MTGLSKKQQSHTHLLGNQDDEDFSALGQGGLLGDASVDDFGGRATSIDPNLEAILGKINSVMGPEPHGSPAGDTQPIVDSGVLSAQQDGVDLQDPVDLLAPYNDVLKEVSAFFSERQSSGLPQPSSLADAGPLGAYDAGSGLRDDFVSDGNGAGRSPVPSYSSIMQETELFKPVQFNSSLAGSIDPPGAVLADQGEAQLLQRELMSRIGQLEQVIGHHFGRQETVVQDVAKAAVEMTLKDIDKTAIGQRLSALETAIEGLKQMQGLRVSSGQEATVVDEPRPEASKKQSEVLPETLAAADSLKETKSEKVAPDYGEGLQAALRDELGDIRTPAKKKMLKAVKAAQKSTLGEGGVKRDEEIEESNAQSQLVDDEGAVPPKVFRDLFKGEGEAMSEKQGEHGVGSQPPPMTARQEVPQEMVGEDAVTDSFIAKSVSLREQFNQSHIVSNDDDLRTVQQKGARPAIIVITVALLLAAVGIGLGSKSFAEFGFVQELLSWFSTSDETVPLAKSDGREGPADGRKVREKTTGFKQDATLRREVDMSVTGNIVTRRGGDEKSSQRLSDPSGEISPEALLPMAAGRLTLPPAAIGPYSLRHAASNGDAAAQFEVARRFGLGQGVERNPEEAVRWYMQAAAQGFAPAQYRLGTFYERGRGVQRSLPRAKIWYKRAAELGNVKAMHNLAVINTAINRETPDYQFSIYWFKQAAIRNLADSQFNLAILYQNGVGVQKNFVEAYRWFSLAARQGDLDAAQRRDVLEKKMEKRDLLLAANMLQAWKPTPVDAKANEVGLRGVHVTSTMSHAHETVQRSRVLTTQILLRKLGYKLHEADGVLNELTIAAIRKFEKEKGLPITGKVTPDLIKMLNKAAL